MIIRSNKFEVSSYTVPHSLQIQKRRTKNYKTGWLEVVMGYSPYRAGNGSLTVTHDHWPILTVTHDPSYMTHDDPCVDAINKLHKLHYIE